MAADMNIKAIQKTIEKEQQDILSNLTNDRESEKEVVEQAVEHYQNKGDDSLTDVARREQQAQEIMDKDESEVPHQVKMATLNAENEAYNSTLDNLEQTYLKNKFALEKELLNIQAQTDTAKARAESSFQSGIQTNANNLNKALSDAYIEKENSMSSIANKEVTDAQTRTIDAWSNFDKVVKSKDPFSTGMSAWTGVMTDSAKAKIQQIKEIEDIEAKYAKATQLATNATMWADKNAKDQYLQTNNLVDKIAGINRNVANEAYSMANTQATRMGNLLLRQFSDDLNKLETKYKDSAEEYKRTVLPELLYKQENLIYNAAFSKSFAAANWEDVYRDITTSDWNLLAGLGRGTTHLADSVFGLLASWGSAVVSLANNGDFSEAEWVHFKKMESLGKRLGLDAYIGDYIGNASVWDKISVGFIFTKLMESLPEMLAVAYPLQRIATIGSRSLAAEQAALQTALVSGRITQGLVDSTVTQLEKMAGIIKGIDTPAATSVNNAIDKILKRFIAIGTTGKGAALKGKDISEMAGFISSAYQFATPLGIASEAILPSSLILLDVSRRINDLVSSRGPGATLMWQDVIGGILHYLGDAAATGYMIGSFNKTKHLIDVYAGRKMPWERAAARDFKTVVAGSMLEEYLAETMQGYIEADARNKYILPSLDDLLWSPKDGIYAKERNQVIEGGVIGLLTGGILGAALNTNVIGKAKDALSAFKNNAFPEINPVENMNIDEIFTVALNELDAEIASNSEALKAAIQEAATETDPRKKAAADAKVQELQDKDQELKDHKKAMEEQRQSLKEAEDRVYGKTNEDGTTTKGSMENLGLATATDTTDGKRYKHSHSENLLNEVNDAQVKTNAAIAEKQKEINELNDDPAATQDQKDKAQAELTQLQNRKQQLDKLAEDLKYLDFGTFRNQRLPFLEKLSRIAAQNQDDKAKAASKAAIKKAREAKNRDEFEEAVVGLLNTFSDKKIKDMYNTYMANLRRDNAKNVDKPASNLKNQTPVNKSQTPTNKKATVSSTDSNNVLSENDRKAALDLLSTLGADVITQLAAITESQQEVSGRSLNDNSKIELDDNIKNILRNDTLEFIPTSILEANETNKVSRAETGKNLFADKTAIVVSRTRFITDENTGVKKAFFDKEAVITSSEIHTTISEIFQSIRKFHESSLDKIMDDIKKILSKDTIEAGDITTLNDYISAINKARADSLQSILNTSAQIAFLKSTLNKRSPLYKKIEQTIYATKQKLLEYDHDINSIYNMMKKKLKLDDADIQKMSNDIDGLAEKFGSTQNGINANIEEVISAISKTSSNLFAGIRKAIQDRQNKTGKDLVNYNKILLRTISRMVTTIKSLYDNIHSQEMYRLASQSLMFLQSENIFALAALNNEIASITIKSYGIIDNNTTPPTQGYNPKKPIVFNSLIRHFQIYLSPILDLFNRAYYSDAEIVLGRILDKKYFLTHIKETDQNELNTAAINNLYRFYSGIFDDVVLYYDMDQQEFVDLSRGIIEGSNKQRMVEISVSDILFTLNLNDDAAKQAFINILGEPKVLDIISNSSISAKKAELQKLVYELVFDDKKHEGFLNSIRERISLDPSKLELIDTLIDVGLYIQANRAIKLEGNELIDNLVYEEVLPLVRPLLDKLQQYSEAEILEFASAAIGLANELMMASKYKEENTSVELATLSKNGIQFNSEFISYLRDQAERPLKTVQELFNDETIVTNNIQDIVLAISRSSMPITQKVQFINALSMTASVIDEEAINIIESELGIPASRLMELLGQEENVITDETFNNLQAQFLSLETERERNEKLSVNGGRDFFGNYFRIPYYEIKSATDNGLHSVGKPSFKYVFIPELAVQSYLLNGEYHYQSAKNDSTSSPAEIAANNARLERYYREVAGDDFKNFNSFVHSLVINPDYAPPKNPGQVSEEDKSTIIAMLVGANAEFGKSLYAILNRNIRNNKLNNNNLNIKAFSDFNGDYDAYIRYLENLYKNKKISEIERDILHDKVNYNADVFYQFSQQPDGRVSNPETGNKFYRIFRRKLPEAIHSIQDLEFMKREGVYVDPGQEGKPVYLAANMQWGAIYDPHTGEVIDRVARPNDLAHFANDPMYAEMRAAQLMGLAKAFGIDPEKANQVHIVPEDVRKIIKDPNSSKADIEQAIDNFANSIGLPVNQTIRNIIVNDGRTLVRNNNNKRVKFSDLTELEKEILIEYLIDGYSLQYTIDINGTVYNLTDLYNGLLSDDIGIRTYSAERIANAIIEFRNSQKFKDKLLRKDAKAHIIHNQNTFLDAFKRDKKTGNLLNPSSRPDIRMDRFDTRELRNYFDGASTLYFQYGIRLLSSRLSQSITGLIESNFNNDPERGIQNMLRDKRIFSLILQYYIDDPNNNSISQVAKNRLINIINDKGLDAHTMPLILYAVTHGQFAPNAFIVQSFINRLADRNSIKGVETPLGYNSGQKSMSDAVIETFNHGMLPVFYRAVSLFVNDDNNTINIQLSGLNSQYTPKALLMEIDTLKKTHQVKDVDVKIKALKHAFTIAFLNYLNNGANRVNAADNVDTYANILEDFSVYFMSDKNIDNLTNALFENNPFKTNNGRFDYINIKNIVDGFKEMFDREMGLVKQYSEEFGQIVITDITNNNQRSSIQMSQELLQLGADIAKILSNTEEVVENANDAVNDKADAKTTQEQAVTNKIARSVMRAIFKEFIPERTIISLKEDQNQYRIEVDTRPFATSTEGKLYYIYIESTDLKTFSYTIKEENGNEADINALIGDLKQYNKSKNNVAINDVFDNAKLDGNALIDLMFKAALFYKLSNGSNLQKHMPIAIEQNPLLFLPRQSSEFVQESMSYVYEELMGGIAYKSVTEYDKLIAEFLTIEENGKKKYATKKDVINSDEFKTAMAAKNQAILKGYLVRYFNMSAWGRNGEYLNTFTSNPSEEIKKQHQEYLTNIENKLLDYMNSLLYRSDIAYTATKVAHSLISYGRNRPLTISNTNGLFNQPFEAYTVSRMMPIGIYNQTFDAVDVNGVGLVQAMRTWNSENSTYSPFWDSASVVNRFRTNIYKAFDVKTADFIDTYLGILEDSNNKRPEYVHDATDFITKRLKFLEVNLIHLLGISSRNREQISANILAAADSGTATGFNVDPRFRHGKQHAALITDLLSEYVKIINRLKSIPASNVDTTPIILSQEHSVRHTVIGDRIPNLYRLLERYNIFNASAQLNRKRKRTSQKTGKDFEDTLVDTWNFSIIRTLQNEFDKVFKNKQEALYNNVANAERKIGKDQRTGLTSHLHSSSTESDIIQNGINHQIVLSSQAALRYFASAHGLNVVLDGTNNIVYQVSNDILFFKQRYFNGGIMVTNHKLVWGTIIEDIKQSIKKHNSNNTTIEQALNSITPGSIDGILNILDNNIEHDGKKYSTEEVYEYLRQTILNKIVAYIIKNSDLGDIQKENAIKLYMENINFKDFRNRSSLSNNKKIFMKNILTDNKNQANTIDINASNLADLSIDLSGLFLDEAVHYNTIFEGIVLQDGSDIASVRQMMENAAALHNNSALHFFYINKVENLSDINAIRSFSPDGRYYFSVNTTFNGTSNVTRDLNAYISQYYSKYTNQTRLRQDPLSTAMSMDGDLGIQQTQETYKNDINNNIDEMIESNKNDSDIVNALNQVKTFVNAVFNRLNEGIEIFYSEYTNRGRGEWLPSQNFLHQGKIVIYEDANLSTRLHEFIHAVTEWASMYPSNKVNVLLDSLAQIQQQLKKEFDINETGITSEEKARRQANRDACGITDDILFNYMFASEGQYAPNSLAEFIAAFFSEPAKLKFLSNFNLTLNFPDVKSKKGSWQHKIELVPAAISYLSNAITSALKGHKGISALSLMEQLLYELTQYNTQEGVLEHRKNEEGKTVAKINRSIVSTVKDIFKRMPIEKYAAIHKINNPREEMFNMFNEFLDNDETMKGLLEYGKKIRGIDNTMLRNASLALWLLATWGMKVANFFNSNPIAREAYNEAMADLRARVLEGTFFNTLIKLDFGIDPNKFLGQQANLINRATSLRNSLDYQQYMAQAQIKEFVRSLLYTERNKDLINEMENNPETLKQYETALFKMITHLNVGDYFTNSFTLDDEGNRQFFVRQEDVRNLVRYMLFAPKDPRILQECRNAAATARINAFDKLGIKENVDMQNAISALVIDLAKARMSDVLNNVGTPNIEMGLKHLGFPDYNSDAMALLHQSITLEAIAYPWRDGTETRDDNTKYFRETTSILRALTTVSETKPLVKEQLEKTLIDLVNLHAVKTRALYKGKALKHEKINEFIQDNNIDKLWDQSTEELYEERDMFGRESLEANYLDSKKWYKYNTDRNLIEMNPDNPPLPHDVQLSIYNGQRARLSDQEKAYYLEEARKHYTALGYKPISLNGKTGEDAIYKTNAGVEVWAFDSSLIKLNPSRTERMYISTNVSHKGRVSYLIDGKYNYESLKPDYNEEYAIEIKKELLERGKKYNDNYMGDENTDYGSRLNTLSGSSTILREGTITNQMYERIVQPETSIIEAFSEMEEQIHKNQSSTMYNNQVFYQIIQSNQEIRNRRASLDSGKRFHNSELLFMIGNDGKVAYNQSLNEKYGIHLNQLDEEEFAKFYHKLPNNIKSPDGNIYIDSRLINMIFGRENLNVAKDYKDTNPYIFKIGKIGQSLLKALLAETKNTIILRNPQLIYINATGNFWGLVGEGIPVQEALDGWRRYSKDLHEYESHRKQLMMMQNTLDVFKRAVYINGTYFIPYNGTNIEITNADQYNRFIFKLREDIDATQILMNNNPVAPLVKSGLYSNLIEDAVSSSPKLIDSAIDWLMKNSTLDEKHAYAFKEATLTEDSDIYSMAGHLTRLGDFIPRVVLYYHLRDKGLSHPEAVDEARNRFINYNTPMWSDTLSKLEQAGLVMFAKYRFAVQYQIYQAFKNAPVQAAAILGINLLSEAAGLSKNLFTSYLEEFGQITPSGAIMNGIGGVFSNLWRYKFIEQFSDDVDSAVFGLAS